MYANPLVAWRDANYEIRNRLAVAEVLQELGWRIRRNRKRADCGVCGGKEDVAFRQDVWHCHKCKIGGSIFDLVMVAKGWDYKTAREYLARLARVELPGSTKFSAQEKRRWAKEQAERKRREEETDAATDHYDEQERAT